MNLHKDRIIQIAMVAAIAVLAIALIWSISANNKNKSALEFGEKLTEEMTGGTGGNEAVNGKTITSQKTATSGGTQPKESTAVTTVPAKTGSCHPDLSGKKSQIPQGILLTWTLCASDDFQFYKLAKSSINSNPGYPADPVVLSSSNKNESNFIDRTVAPNTKYYYRVCVIERLGKVTCGNTISVNY
jgi:hypothetical protein